MRYLLFWDIWSADPGMRAYFKLKDHQIIGTPHGATILDRIMKNEAAPFSHPCLVGKRYIFPIYFVQHRRQPGGILNINYSRLRDEIPAPGNSVPWTLVKAKPR